jgi:urea transport system permease protein
MISGRLFGSDRRIGIAIAILVAIAIVVPILNLAVPPDSAFHVPSYMVALVGKYLCYALLALSLDLVWGYCGILSLGHGAFFALGGYAMGMYLMRQIGSRGVYGNPDVPDFMVFLNWKELPWFWYGFDQFWFAAIMVMLVPGLLAFVFGWFAFRSRVTGVYLSIITQAMTYALLLAFFRNDMGFGGNNGLTDFKDILGFNVQANATRSALFSASALALALGVFITWAIVTSKYGKLLVAVRDAESRTRFLGWRAENVKLFAFTLSAVMAGIAGALYVPQVGIINPGEFDPANSIEVVVWTAVGGRGTIVGPIIGALLVNAGKSWFTGALPEFWLFALGGLFVAVTLFLPKGIMGLWDQWRGGGKRERQASIKAEEGIDTDDTAAEGGPRRARRVARETEQRPRAAAGGVVDVEIRHHPLSRRRLALVRRLSRRSTICRSCSTAARCAPSSAPTAPARPR